MDDLTALLKTMNFSPAALIAGLIFSAVGFVAFMYGKKNRLRGTVVIGIALMIYPYFVWNAVLICVIGIALTAGLYFWRE
jgi:hypothetical protein